MPLLFKKDCHNGGIVAVWQITEPVEELLEELALRDCELSRVSSFKLDKRKAEFLATRCLIKEVLGITPEIDYQDSGKPVLQNADYNLSISHTKGYAAIVLSKGQYAGIDIEYPSDRVQRVYERFVSLDEQQFIPEGQRVEYYTLIWCLKEAMFKMFDEQSIIFNEHLVCRPFKFDEEGELKALYRKEKEVELSYRFSTVNGFYLVYHC
ncbi:4'-phosphopantetheinyl transferase family protein [Plebeiibacterium marinum]|uniref:4'-phosphopantetheinyl transferase superfamily protein n=1 Tax=Plebeiibacterium marinum TaxID=2992111 RepID=A0AAE3MF14_9BACT|nr:4'-phosphopantetheinyl transferase superfamily protein [Plebeiobacterium marinum]MCW3806531.1 4'-phosphopantetheinyl transferase superfamily protein [Plebeiobacterium marinum]